MLPLRRKSRPIWLSRAAPTRAMKLLLTGLSLHLLGQEARSPMECNR